MIKKGAGDAFIGALAHYMSKSSECSIDYSLFERAIHLAVEYASLSVERKGAQTSYLHLNELDLKFQ